MTKEEPRYTYSADDPEGGFVRNIKYHLVDSTAILAASHPIFSTFETFVSGMSDDVSLNTRLYITGLTYAGLGWAIGKGRDASRKFFKIDPSTRERIQKLHDSLYLASMNIPLSIGLYTAAGETDMKKIAIGTGMGVLFGALMGPWVGYAIDSSRDLAGLEECTRKSYPDTLKKQKKNVKRGIGALLVAASIGLMGLVYSLTPDQSVVVDPPPAIEQTLEQKVQE